MTILPSLTAGVIIASANMQRNDRSDFFNYIYSEDRKSMIAYYDSSEIMNNMTILKRANKKKLNMMRNLTSNWDGEGASEFSDIVIDRVEAFLDLTYPELPLPNIFPTFDGKIQLEYYNGKKYMQFIVSDSSVECYYTDGENIDNDIFRELEYDCNNMLSLVRYFYNADYKDVIWTKN